ncbi:MAG: ArnT family glycosyltransferase [Anaerolineae bacterium]
MPVKRTSRTARYAPAALALILLVAAAFRLYGLRWEDGLPGYPHPDERHVANTMQRLALPSPIDWNLILNDPANSPLNPRKLIPDGTGRHYDLAYGTLPVYLYRATAVLLSKLSGDPSLDSYSAYGVIGRSVTALFSLLTVFWVYRIGQRVFGDETALLGAALLATCVLHIQLSHFMTVDLLMTAMLTAGLLFAVRFAQSGSVGNAIGMGALLGLGMATKFNAITLGAGIGAAYIAAWLGGKRPLRDLLAFCVPLTLLFWFLGFTAFEYYAVRDPYTYAQAIGVQAKMVTGETDWPYTRQYINTLPYLFQLKNLILWGMGLPLGVAAVAGTVSAAAVLLNGLVRARSPACDTVPVRRDAHHLLRAVQGKLQNWMSDPRHAGLLVLLGWAVPYFAYTARLEVKFLRYMLPLTPVLCLLSADLLLWLGRWLSSLWRRRGRASAGIRTLLGVTPFALVLLSSSFWSLAYTRVWAQVHPWVAASLWFYENAPQGSTYTWEAWGDPLPSDLPARDLYRAGYGFLGRDVWMHIYEDMPPEQKLEHIADALQQADFVVLSTPRIYLSVARAPWRYPVAIRYYELLFTGQLGFELAAKFTASPGLGPIEINDLSADQSFYDYDHPLVLIYRKTRDLSTAEWQSLFAQQLQSEPRASREGTAAPIQLPVP